MAYTIIDHKHHFASWAASTAARASPLCRFGVQEGCTLIERSGLSVVGTSIENLPNPADFDDTHRLWRRKIRRLARPKHPGFTDGVAAKLINVYLKAIFVCGGCDSDERVKAIHPPIDGIILDALAKEDAGRHRALWQHCRWSKLSSRGCEEIIRAVKAITPPGEGLWSIEHSWKGYR